MSRTKGRRSGVAYLVAADHLAIGVLNRGDVGVLKGIFDEAQDEGGFADACCTEDDDAVVVLLRHLDDRSLVLLEVLCRRRLA